MACLVILTALLNLGLATARTLTPSAVVTQEKHQLWKRERVFLNCNENQEAWIIAAITTMEDMVREIVPFNTKVLCH
jgi:hypothetical protein